MGKALGLVRKALGWTARPGHGADGASGDSTGGTVPALSPALGGSPPDGAGDAKDLSYAEGMAAGGYRRWAAERRAQAATVRLVGLLTHGALDLTPEARTWGGRGAPGQAGTTARRRQALRRLGIRGG